MYSRPILLASKSPRRQELLNLMGLNFQVILKEVDEDYPDTLQPEEIAVYIAEKKANAFDQEIGNSVLVTADTIVCINGEVLGKPLDEEDAYRMISKLSGKTHQVITGVCIRDKNKSYSFYEVSEVTFVNLSAEQINYYIQTGNPLDKAGAYGIQEWIGLVAIASIRGSYTNVVGLPTHRLFEELNKF